mgnify:CR=1 FL=1
MVLWAAGGAHIEVDALQLVQVCSAAESGAAVASGRNPSGVHLDTSGTTTCHDTLAGHRGPLGVLARGGGDPVSDGCRARTRAYRWEGGQGRGMENAVAG